MSNNNPNRRGVLYFLIPLLVSAFIATVSAFAGWGISIWVKSNDSATLMSLIVGSASSVFFLILAQSITNHWILRERTEEIKAAIETITPSDRIRVLSTALDGLKNDIDAARSGKVTEIYNTVLRYGASVTNVGYTPADYKEWTDLKIDFLKQRKQVKITEIISTHIHENPKDPQTIFVKKASDLGFKAAYKSKYLDDASYPMMQVCIIHFEDRPSQVTFGHQSPENEIGPCFSSTDKAVVNYFMSYFRYWFDNKCVHPTQGSSNISGDWLIYRYLYAGNSDHELACHCDMWSIFMTNAKDHSVNVNRLPGQYPGVGVHDYKCQVLRHSENTLNILIDGKKYPQKSLVCFSLDMGPSLMIGIGAGGDSRHKICTRIYLACRKERDVGYKYAESFIAAATELLKMKNNNEILYMPSLLDVQAELSKRGIT